MLACPHCNQLGVSGWEKLRAGIAMPAICRECKRPSSVSGTLRGVIGAAFQVVLLVGAFASIFFRSWWPLILCLASYVGVELLVLKYAPLKPLSEYRVKKARLGLALFLVALVVVITLGGVLS